MNALKEWKVVDLMYIEFADSQECDCGEGMSRWIDANGKTWCEKCVGRIENCWREIYPS